MQRPVQHTAAAVADWLREGRRVVAGLLVEVEGSSPLDVGASMYVDDQGGIEGSITGGCVEGAVAQAAMEILETGGPPQLVTYGISDELAGTVGLMCGGIVHIFIHELRGEAREAVLRDLEALVEERPAALVTLLDGPQAGSKLYVDVVSTNSFGALSLTNYGDSCSFNPTGVQYSAGAANQVVVVRLFYQWPLFVTKLGFIHDLLRACATQDEAPAEARDAVQPNGRLMLRRLSICEAVLHCSRKFQIRRSAGNSSFIFRSH